MSTIHAPVSDMLVTVKSRELQRGMLAEMRGESEDVARHFLAAAHLELVLANDYELADQDNLALRSQISAASCFWRTGQVERARAEFEALVKRRPEQTSEVQRVVAELENHDPG